MNSNVKTVNTASLAFSVAMLLASAVMAFNAYADEPVRTAIVAFQDLNVDTPAGIAQLYGRIHAASERVCLERGDNMAALVTRICARKAEANAVQAVKLPALTAYYQTITGHSPQTLTAKR